jgi:hypothetical protein
LVAAPAIINELSMIASTYGPQLMGVAQNLADKISGDSGGNDSSNPDPNKGKEIVGPEGQSGIKRLAPNTKVGGKIFEFEVKVKDQFANYRLYGNLDKSTGTFV